MSKIINGRTYTHQTAHPRPAREIFVSLHNQSNKRLFVVYDEGSGSEYIVMVSRDLRSDYNPEYNLSPIPEQKIVAWTFETCPRDLVVRIKENQIDEVACSFDRSLVYFRGGNLNYSYKSLMGCCDRVMTDGSLVPCGVVTKNKPKVCANCGIEFEEEDGGYMWVCGCNCALIHYHMTPPESLEPIEDEKESE